MDRCRSIQHIFLRTRRRVLVRCGQRAWVGYQRPKCMWLALLALQLWFAEHKQYGVLTIPIAGTVGKADGKFWDYDDGVQNYLMQFGYLEKSNIETGNLRTIDELEQAVRKLQSYGNIKQTGKVDPPTLELMRRPRCGSPDFRDSLDFLANNDERLESRRRTRRYVKQGQKWHNPVVTWSLVNQTMGLLDAGQVRRILYEALDLWSRHANISFRETYSTEADIQVMFARKFHGDGYNFDGPGKILAHAFYPGTGIGGDAHFDEEESWLLNEPLDAEGTRLFDVALHEFGHSLGLGHSSQQNAIMFPWHHISYRGKDTIPEDDRLGIESIYGPRTKRYGPNPERHTPRTSTTTTTVAPTPPPRPTTKPHYPSKGVPGHPREGYPNRVPNYPRVTIPTTTPTTEMPRSREYFPSYGNRHPVRHHTTTTTTPTTTTHHRQHHHPHHRPVTPTRRTHHDGPTPPNACNTSFDAITMIRNELFVFKDRWLWRMEQKKTSDGIVEAHRPPVAYEINRLFFGLPDDFVRIDTVYENKYQKIIFFIGKQYFVFNSQNIEPGYPRPLTDLGLPESIERIDAALVWSHNNRTYLYSGRLYWRFDEDTNKVELDYPRDMSIWKGIGYNIDAAFQYSDGKTYFFKGLGYWRFNDMRMRVSHDQQPSATRWMRCPNERQVQNDLDDPSEPTDLPDRDLHPRLDTSRSASRWSCYNLAPLLLLSLSLIAAVHH